MNSFEERRRGPVRHAVIAVVVTVALVVGSAAVALTVSDGLRAKVGFSGKSVVPMAAALKGKAKYKLSAKVLKGPLIPGVAHPLKVTVANPTSKALTVYSIKVKAAKPKGFPGCKPGWIKATAFKATKKKKPISVKAHGKAIVKLSISMTNLATVNQDACKSARIPLKLSAQAK